MREASVSMTPPSERGRKTLFVNLIATPIFWLGIVENGKRFNPGGIMTFLDAHPQLSRGLDTRLKEKILSVTTQFIGFLRDGGLYLEDIPRIPVRTTYDEKQVLTSAAVFRGLTEENITATPERIMEMVGYADYPTEEADEALSVLVKTGLVNKIDNHKEKEKASPAYAARKLSAENKEKVLKILEWKFC